MNEDIALRPMAFDTDAEDALDLATRASDYAVLEIGRGPDADYIQDFFTAVPPEMPANCLLHFAIMQGPAMAGMICIAKGYEYPDDWWVGLMLIDPAFRGRGIGRKVIADLKTRARRQRIRAIKLAVLAANPRALKFWRRESFVHHRDAPALTGSDGHDRIVLKCAL